MSLRVLIGLSLLAAIIGLVFGIWPELDLTLSHAFLLPPEGFVTGRVSAFAFFRDISMWPPNAIWVLALLALLAKLALPRRDLLVPGVAAIFLIVTSVGAPLLMMNGLLKQYSGRPRPVAVEQFGGTLEFKAWWDMSGACPRNCSFASGESSQAFWLVAPAALTPPPFRPAAYIIAIGYGTIVALLRMAFGAHFFTDVFFGAYLTYVVIWLMHRLLFRWRRTRLSNEGVEDGLAEAGLSIGRVLRRLTGRLPPMP